MRLGLQLPLAISLALSAASCADGPHADVRYAPEYTPGPAKIAVLGAFTHGRLSAESWYPLAPRVSSALGRTTCDAAFGDKLKRADPELYEKIDADVTENGITDEMLDRIAPKSGADLIMTITIHGRIDRSMTPAATSQDPTIPGYRPGAAGGNPGRGRQSRGRVMEWRGIEMSASLFSTKLHRSVGRITLRYPGSNADAAVTAFAAKLGMELQGSKCQDWSW